MQMRFTTLALLAGSALAALAAPFSTNLPPELARPTAGATECNPRGGLPNFFERLKQGGEVRIAYLGGSITAQEGWRPKTLQWFQKQFPQAKVSQINAAIGGTGSDLGVFRLQQDVLQHQPHLLFVEFAVNDGGAAPAQIYRCMEGIVRQTWKSNPLTDICFVYTLAGNMLQTLQERQFPRSASAMEKLADYYGIPSIHMGIEVARLEKAGRLVFKGEKPKTDAEKAALGDKIIFSPDAVHPYTDTGHQLYLEAVVRGMALIQPAGRPGPHTLGEPFVADHWEAAKLAPLSPVMLTGNWQKLDPAKDRLARNFRNRLPQLWKAAPSKTALTFRFNGIAAGVYDILGPDCGQLQVTVDGQPPRKVLRFDSYCTYHRLGQFMAATGLPPGLHTVKVEVSSEPFDKAKILAQRNEKMDDPKRFEELNWYPGFLMLIGELVE